MASIVCPLNLDTQRLREEILSMYARVAVEPAGDFHFHRGSRYAVERLGYDAAELAELPAIATESFAGVANPLAIGALRSGETVVDVGSGSGMDLMLAARRVRPKGRAIGIDITAEMIAKCRRGAAEAGLDNIEVREGDVGELPVADASADVVISNGVLNLAPDKLRAFTEVHRVLRAGGRLQLGDIAVESELSAKIRGDFELWAA
jgi:arsenite methyltransferase